MSRFHGISSSQIILPQTIRRISIRRPANGRIWRRWLFFGHFRELAGSDNRYLAAYRESLDKVARTNPDDAEVLSGLGSLEPGGASAENAAKTIDLLSRAVERGSTRSSDYMFSRRFWRRMAAGRMR